MSDDFNLKPISSLKERKDLISVEDKPDNPFNLVPIGKVAPRISYDVYLPESEKAGLSSFEKTLYTPQQILKERAKNQSWQSQLGLGAVNFIPNIATGLFEMVGLVGELLYYGGMKATGQEFKADFSNALTEAMVNLRDPFGEIYLENPDDILDWDDSGWWIKHGSGLIQSLLEFAVPGVAIAKLATKGVTGSIKLFQKIIKSAAVSRGVQIGGKITANAITAGSLGYLEGGKTGAPVFQQVFDDKYAETGDYDFAIQEASEAAASTVKTNTALIAALSATTTMPLFMARASTGVLGAASKYGLKKLPTESISSYIKRLAAFEGAKPIGESLFSNPKFLLATETVQESAEELGNLYAEQVGLQKVGMSEYDETGLDLYFKLAGTDEGKLSMMLGALGGAGQKMFLDNARFYKVKDGDEVKRMSLKEIRKKELAEAGIQYAKQLETDLRKAIKLQEDLVTAVSEGNDALATNIKNRLFDIYSKRSILFDEGESAKAFMSEISNIDNERELQDVYQEEIQVLEDAKAEANEEQLNEINTRIEELNKLIVEDQGKTQAMKMGLADSKEDNEYKSKARDKINEISEITKKYKEYYDLYNFGEEETYQLADKVFSIYLDRKRAEEDIINLSAEHDRILSETESLAVDQTELERSLFDFYNKKLELDASVEELNKIEKELRNVKENINVLREKYNLEDAKDIKEEIKRRRDKIVEKTSEKKIEAQKAYNDAVKKYSEEELNRILEGEIEEAVSGELDANMEKEVERIVEDYKIDRSNKNYLKELKTKISELEEESNFLNRLEKEITSSKGRKDFVEKSKKAFIETNEKFSRKIKEQIKKDRENNIVENITNKKERDPIKNITEEESKEFIESGTVSNELKKKLAYKRIYNQPFVGSEKEIYEKNKSEIDELSESLLTKDVKENINNRKKYAIEVVNDIIERKNQFIGVDGEGNPVSLEDGDYAGYGKLNPDGVTIDSVYERSTSIASDPIDMNQQENESDEDYRKRKLMLASSQVIGNEFDEFVRDYFEGDGITDEELSQYRFAPPEEIRSFRDSLYTLAQSFKENGEIVYPKDILLSSDSGFAGTADIITIDEAGNFRIYDVKTIRNYSNKITQYDADGKKIGKINKYDFKGYFDSESKKYIADETKDSLRDKHQKQLSLYNIALENSYGINFIESFVIPIDVSYNPGDQMVQKAKLNPIIKIDLLSFVDRFSLRYTEQQPNFDEIRKSFIGSVSVSDDATETSFDYEVIVPFDFDDRKATSSFKIQYGSVREFEIMSDDTKQTVSNVRSEITLFEDDTKDLESMELYLAPDVGFNKVLKNEKGEDENVSYSSLRKEGTDNVPIAVINKKNNEIIGYLPRVDWISRKRNGKYLNIGVGTPTRPIDVEGEIQALKDLRKSVVERHESQQDNIPIRIALTTIGTFIKNYKTEDGTLEGRVVIKNNRPEVLFKKTSELLPDPNIEFGIVNNELIYTSILEDGSAVPFKLDGELKRTSYKKGTVVANIGSKSSPFWVPVKIGNQTEQVTNTVYESLIAYNNEDQEVLNSIKDASNEELDALKQKDFIHSLLNKFYFIKSFLVKDLINAPNRVFLYASKKEGYFYIGKGNRIITNDPKRVNKSMNNVTYVPLEGNEDLLKEFLSAAKTSVKLYNGLNDLNKPYEELVVKDGVASIQNYNNYNEFIKQGLETYINGTNTIEYEEGGETKRKYVYFEQPAVYFEIEEDFFTAEKKPSVVEVDAEQGISIEQARIQMLGEEALEETPELETETEESEFAVEDDLGLDIDETSFAPVLEFSDELTEEQKKLLDPYSIGYFSGEQQFVIKMTIVHLVKKHIERKQLNNEPVLWDDAFKYAKNALLKSSRAHRQEGNRQKAEFYYLAGATYWDEFSKEAELYFNKAGYRRKKDETVESENSNYERKKYDYTFDVNIKDTANAIVKLELSFIPDLYYDEEGNLAYRKNFLDLPSYISLDKIWQKISNELMDVKKDMPSMIEALANSGDPQLKYVKKLLNENKYFRNNFYSTFSAQRITKIESYTRRVTKESGGESQTTMISSVARTDRNEAISAVIKEFSENMKITSPFVTENEDGDIIIDVQKVVNFKKRIFDNFKDKELTSRESFNLVSIVAKTIGIDLSGDDIYNYINRGTQLSQQSIIKAGLDNNYSFINTVFDILLSGVEVDENFNITSDLGDSSYSLRSPILSPLIGKDLRELARIKIKRDGYSYSESYQNINNDTIYPFQKMDYLYNKVMNLRDPDYVESLNEGILTKASKLKGKGSLLNIFYIDGLRNDNSNFARETHRLGRIDLNLTLMNMFFGKAVQTDGNSAYFAMPSSDKKQVAVLEAPINKYRVNFDNFNEDEFRLTNIPKRALKDLLDYAMAEYERSFLTNEFNKQGYINKEDPYKKGHKYFFMFPFLNYDSMSSLVEKGALTQEELEVVYPTGTQEVSGDYEAVKNIFSRLIDSYYTAELNKTIKSMIDSNLIGNLKKISVDDTSISILEDSYLSDEYFNKAPFGKIDTKTGDIVTGIVNMFLNYAVFNAERMILFGGDPAFYWKNSVAETLDVYEKRAAKNIAPRVSENYEGKSNNITRLVIEDIKVSVNTDGLPDSYYKSNIDINDGSQFIIVSRAIDFLEGIGKITPEKAEELRSKVKPGEYYEFTNEELEKYFSPIKDIYTGEEYDENLKAFRPVYIKDASFILLPQIMKNADGEMSEFNKVRVLLEKEGIDMVTMASASKVGANKILPMFDGKNFKELPRNKIIESIQHLDKQYYGLQQEESYKDKTEIKIITQLDTLLFTGIRDYENFDFKGKKLKGRELEEVKDQVLREIYTKNKKILYNELGIEYIDGAPVITNFSKIKRLIQKSAEQTGWSRHATDSFRLSEDGTSIIVPQELTVKFGSIQSLLLSILSKPVKLFFKGQSYVQAPSLIISSPGETASKIIEPEVTEEEAKTTAEAEPVKDNKEQIVHIPTGRFGITSGAIDENTVEVTYDNGDVESVPRSELKVKTEDDVAPVVEEQPSVDLGSETAPQAGVEISSNAKGLAAALTNPTERAKSKRNLDQSYPIEFNGQTYKDVETAYQTLKDKSEAKTKPTKENSSNYKLMVDLISTKLQQHPELVSQIAEQGGAAWILSSTHQPTKQNTVWETGGQNWFIESLADAYNEVVQTTQPETGVKEIKPDLSEKNIFTVEPIKSVDKKSKSKAKIATQYIGFAEGISGSSTALYAEQAGEYANTGNYSSDDIVFVSIGGKRGNKTVRKKQQDKTINEAVKALEAGATLITDNADYVKSSSYNEGEKRLAAKLKDKGYNYSEVTVDGNLLGVWNKGVASEPEVEQEQMQVEEVKEVKKKKVDVRYLNPKDSFKIVTTKNFDSKKGLQYTKAKDGTVEYAQVMVTWDFRDANGNILDINDFLDENGNIDSLKLPQEVLKSISSRIPNQAHPSMLPIEIVGFLPPGYGKTIIVPDGITLQMGSDFDIDKLYAYLNDYIYDVDTQTIKSLEITSSLDNAEALYDELFGAFGDTEQRSSLMNEVTSAIKKYNKDRSPNKNIFTYLYENITTPLTPKQLVVLSEIAKDSELNGIIPEQPVNIPLKEEFLNNKEDNMHWYFKYLPLRILKTLYFDVHKSVYNNPEVLKLMNQPLENNDLENEKTLIGTKKGTLTKMPPSPLLYNYTVDNALNKWAGADLVGVSAIGLTTNSLLEDKDIFLEKTTPNSKSKYYIPFKVGGKVLKLSTLSGTGKSMYNGEVRTKIDNLRALITTSVDNANVNQAGYINFNAYTASVAIVLSILEDSNGESIAFDSIFRFLSQDSIYAYIDELEKMSWSDVSSFTPDKEKTALKKVASRILKRLNLSEEERDNLIKDVKNSPVPDPETLLDLINKQPSDDEYLEYAKNQIIVLRTFDTLLDISKELVPVRKALLNPFVDQLPTNLYNLLDLKNNLDSIKKGSNMVANMSTLLGTRDETGSIVYNTRAGYVAENIIEPSMSIIESMFPVYGRLMPMIEEYYIKNLSTGSATDLNSSVRKALWEGVVSYIWQNSELFDLGNVNDLRADLFYEFPKRVQEAKSKSWGKNNLFVQRLLTDISENKENPSFVHYQATRAADFDEENLVSSIAYMMKSKDPEEKKFVEDAYKYAMMYGARFSTLGYMHILPSAWFEKEFTGIFDKIRNLVNEDGVNINIAVKQVTRNRPYLIPILNEHEKYVSENEAISISENNPPAKITLPDVSSEEAPKAFVTFAEGNEMKYLDQLRIQMPDGSDAIYERVGAVTFTRVQKLGFGRVPEFFFDKQRPNSFFNAPVDSEEGVSIEPAVTASTTTPEASDDIKTEDMMESYFPSNKTSEEAIMTSLDKVGSNNYYNDLSAIMKKALENSGISIKTNNRLPSVAGYVSDDKTLYYNLSLMKSKKMTIPDFERVILHEYGHAITDTLITDYLEGKKLPEKELNLIKSLERVYNKVRRELTKGNESEFNAFMSKLQRQKTEGQISITPLEYNWYAVHSFKEFAASIWDERFQGVLNNIDYDSGRTFMDRIKIIMEKLFSSLANSFGITVKDKSALKESIGIVLDIALSDAEYLNKRVQESEPETKEDTKEEEGGSDIEELRRQFESGSFSPVVSDPAIVGTIAQTKAVIRDIKSSIGGTIDPKDRSRLTNLLDIYTQKLKDLQKVRTPEDLIKFAASQLDIASKIIDDINSTSKEYVIAFTILDSWDFVTSKDFLPTSMQSKNNIWYRSLSTISGRKNSVEGELLNKTRNIIAKMINEEFNLEKEVTARDLAEMEDVSSVFQTLDASVSKNTLLQYLNRIIRNALNSANSEFLVMTDQIENKIRELGFKKDDFGFMFQRDKDGELTGRIIHEYTYEYDSQMSEIHELFYSRIENADKLDSEAGNELRRLAVKEFTEELKRLNEYLDIRYFIPTEEKYKDQAKYVKYLEKEYGVTNANKFIEVAKEKYAEFELDRETYKANLIASIDGMNMSEVEDALNDESKESYINRKVAQWVKVNSPQRSLFESESKLLKSEYVNKRGRDYLTYFPRKTIDSKESNFYNSAYENLTEKQVEWLNFFSNVMLNMKQYFPKSVQNSMPENFYPSIMKESVFEFSKRGIGKYMDKKLMKSLTNGSVSFSEIKEDATSLEKRRKSRSQRMGYTRNLLTYVDTRNKMNPNDVSQNVELVMKMFTEMAIMYKYRNNIESEALVINRIIQGADQIDSEGNLIPREKALVNIKKHAEHMIKSGVYNRKSEESKPTGFVMMEGWNVIENSRKRRRLKEIKKEYLELENKLAQNYITSNEYEKALESLEMEYSEIGGKPLVLTKVGQTILELNQLKHMGWNPRAGFANMGFGLLSLFTWSAGNPEFSTNDVIKAIGTVITTPKTLGKLKAARVVKKLNVLFEVRDVTFGRGNARLESDISALKFFSKLVTPFQIQQSTEYFVQGTSTIAQMLSQKVEVTKKSNGEKETISLYDALDDNGDWNTELYEEIKDWDFVEGKKMAEFRNKVIKTNYYMHGNYDPDNMPLFKRSLFMRFLFQFRSWIPYGVAQRFIGSYYDPDLGREFKGRWISYKDVFFDKGAAALLKTAFVTSINSKENAIKKLSGDISDIDIRNMRMNMRELQIYAGFLFFAYLIRSAMPDDDEEETLYKNIGQILLNQMFRIEQDIVFYINPKSAEDIIRNPIPATKLYIDYSNAISSLMEFIIDPENYEKDSPLKKFGKATPFSNQIVNIMYSANNSYRDK